MDTVINRLKEAEKNNEHVSSGADAGSHQCVALVKYARPDLGPTKDWKQGDPVTPDSTTLKPGVALAKGWDKDGNYPSNATGNHAIYVTQVNPDKVTGKISSLTIAEQWGPGPSKLDQPVKIRDMLPAEYQLYSTINHR